MELLQIKNNKSKNQIKKFKERMKDRHKINGLKFDYSKKEEKKYFVEPRKKEKEQKNIISEYEEFILLQNYNKLKHQIFLREQKEKEKLKTEKELFKKFQTDFNYTTLLKIIERFSSINPFNYDIRTGKMEIDRADRNIKINRINEMLKRIILHFMKIKAKLNIKKDNPKKEYISQETVNEIKNKIYKHKKKLQSRNNKLIFKNNYSENIDTNNLYIKSTNSRKRKNTIFMNSYNRRSKSNLEINSNHMDSINNKNPFISSSSSYIDKRSSNIMNSDKILTNNTINYINPKKEGFNSSEDFTNKKINRRNSYYLNESKEDKIRNSLKERFNIKRGRRKTLFYLSPNIQKKDSNLKAKNNENLRRYNSTLLIEDNSPIVFHNSILKKKSQINLKNKLYYRPRSCINKNSKNKKDLNIFSNDKNFNKNNSCINRRSYLKVKNLPLYTTKIADLIKEYNRIKKNSKKLKINYKEKHFSTYKEIDNIIKTKEDMLMFLLKQKYFNCKFPQKKIKPINHKSSFSNKMKQCIDLIEERPSIFINLERNLEL